MKRFKIVFEVVYEVDAENRAEAEIIANVEFNRDMEQSAKDAVCEGWASVIGSKIEEV